MYCDEMGGLRVAWERLSDREQAAWKAVAREELYALFLLRMRRRVDLPGLRRRQSGPTGDR